MSDLKIRISNWLDEQGYPFEMFVAQQFKKAGFYVSQSVFYVDEESGKSREIDVIAYITQKVDGVFFNFTFVIECKVSKDKPWIIFTSENEVQPQDFVFERYMTKNWRLLFKTLNDSNDKRPIEALNMFIVNDKEIGYSITQAFTKGEDITYSALHGVTKASVHFLKKTNETRRRMCNIYFPIIAVDGPLFLASIGKNGEILINPTEESKLVWRRSYDTHPTTVIDIVAKDAIFKQANELRDFCMKFFDLARQEMEKVASMKPYNASDSI